METPKGKCHLIVDGSYVHKVCIRLGAEFDFALLVKWLEAMLGVECDTRVFVDFIPDPSKPFYCQLRKYGFECVSCEMKTETKYDPVQQKEFSCRVQMGADVQIALFMTLWAHDEKCSHIAVLTGDGDFFPVFAYIKNHTNKDLRLLCFNGAAHECLLPHCTRTFIDELDSVLVARPGTVIRPLVSVRQRTLYVGNMPDGFPTEENIHELFKDYGEIDSIRLALIQGRSYIYARVTFSDHASAGRALLALNGHLVGESKRPLRIEWDAARKKRAPAPTASSSGILVGERSSPVSSDTSPVMSPSSATMRCDAPPSLQLGAPEFVPRARAAPTPPCAVEFHPVAAQALPYVPMPIAVQVPPPPVAAQAPPCVPPPSPFVSVESPRARPWKTCARLPPSTSATCHSRPSQGRQAKTRRTKRRGSWRATWKSSSMSSVPSRARTRLPPCAGGRPQRCESVSLRGRVPRPPLPRWTDTSGKRGRSALRGSGQTDPREGRSLPRRPTPRRRAVRSSPPSCPNPASRRGWKPSPTACLHDTSMMTRRCVAGPPERQVEMR